ncbi:MAG: hypothetical protein KY476_10160 [Planctomycetes bacterium]|nr:hypothetical protein [Planctomycetota bacterium]
MVTNDLATAFLVVDRRRADRRTNAESLPDSLESTDDGMARRGPRRKQERRRQIDPTTCERDYSEDEVEFMRSMDEYKRKSGRQFPTWSEVLEVLYSMGYRKVAEPSELVMKSR